MAEMAREHEQLLSQIPAWDPREQSREEYEDWRRGEVERVLHRAGLIDEHGCLVP